MKLFNSLLSLSQHQGFVKYLKNTGWLMTEQMLRILSGLFVGIWVARYLGPEQFGVFSYVLAFTAIFAGIAKLGLDGIVVRELLNQPAKHADYLGTAFWLKVLGACLVMGLMVFIVPFTSNDSTTNTFIFIIAAGLVFQSFEVVEFYFQSQVLAKTVSICKVIQLTFSSLLKIFLVLNEAELIWFVVIASFDVFSLAVVFFIAYQTKVNMFFYNRFNYKLAKILLKDAWPLVFTAVVIMVYMRIDQIMIKEMLGETEVGIYSAAVRLSEAFYFIPMLLTASIFPAIVNAKKISAELYQKRLLRLYTFLTWLAIAIAVPMTFLGDWLIEMLFGEAYAAAGQVLVIHIWAGVFVFLGVAFGKYLLAENLTRNSFHRALLGAVVNIIANLILIPRFGIEGAAVATLISQFTASIFYDFFEPRLYCQLKLKLEALFLPWKAIK